MKLTVLRFSQPTHSLSAVITHTQKKPTTTTKKNIPSMANNNIEIPAKVTKEIVAGCYERG